MAEALIIDDNRTTADALRQMLAVLGFNGRVAYSAGAAMSVLATGFVPSFVCLDINMPGIDGTEILAYLRREPRFIPVSVFVITSDDQPETRRKVMKLGANAMIIKPATIDALERVLQTAKLL
ncbi:MAG TPA: response regulator [Anaerolineales bacterium]|jgi:PleD family two-component response regulator|nr:response regulator [Anaerolineales bacterium]